MSDPRRKLRDKLLAHKMFACVDCSHVTLDQYYMVRDSVWAAAGMTCQGGMLCFDCLEKRLGGQLERTHFTECLLNRFPQHPIHVDRLAGDGPLHELHT